MSQPDPGAIYGPAHPPPPPPPPPTPPTQAQALAALAAAERPVIPVRRGHLALYALSETGYLAAVLALVLVVIPTTTWTGTVVGLVAVAIAMPPLLLKNLVPVVSTVARRISTAGAVLTIPVVFVIFSVEGLSLPAQYVMALVPSVLAGVLLVLVGVRRP